MKNNDYSLSMNNLKRINFNKYEKNFIFNVNGKQYKTSRVIADILSPTINNYHYTDESINEFDINIKSENINNTNDEEQTTDYFQDFLQLQTNESKNIDEQHRKYYSEYFLQIGNIEEYFQLQPMITSDLTLDNIYDCLRNISQKCNDLKNFERPIILSYENVKQIIEFASSHFYELDKEKMKNLDDFIIIEIIQNEKLKIDEEDTLLRFIIDKYQENDKYSILFENILFNNISEKGLEEFINVFSIENLNITIWKSICSRLLPSHRNENENDKTRERYIESNYNIIEIKHNEGEEFKGIFNYLTQTTGGNIHDNGTIQITSNSILNNNNTYHPKNLVDFQKSNYFESKDEQDVNIYFDLKDKSIQITNYSIKSYNSGQNSGHLRNWVVEVSNDNKNWEIVDEHKNDSILNTPNIIKTFNTKQTKSFYKYVRLRQTGTSWYNGNNNYYIYFYCFEIYGKLKQPKSNSE